MFTPGIQEIAHGLDTSTDAVIGAATGFVVMLGIGPLILAPLSETFGRRTLYLTCFSIFTLLQVPTAFSPDVTTLITLRTLSGFFGSVVIANGGGSLSDLFYPEERAGVFGWYLLGPLLGPTLGPLLGGVIVQRLGWRWIFLTLAIICGVNTTFGFLFLKETYAPVLLQRKMALEQKQRQQRETSGGLESETAPLAYWYEGEDHRPLVIKLRHSLSRPLRILMQPIVLTLSLYQALVYSTMYSLYTNFEDIYGGQYGFDTEQVGLVYLGCGLGSVVAIHLLVPRIDDVYKRLIRTSRDGQPKPEYRVPLANIGSVLIPVSLFW